MSGCGDGTGAYIGFDIVSDFACRETGDAGELVAETQALINGKDDPISTKPPGLLGVVLCKSIGPWESNVESIGSPNVQDGCGSINRMRKGCGRTNPEWVAVVDYSGEYPIEALVGAEGTIRRWNPDGSYREAYGWCSGATVIPNHASGEEPTGELRFQWEGGKPGNAVSDPIVAPDRGFVQMWGPGDTPVTQFPVMPALV